MKHTAFTRVPPAAPPIPARPRRGVVLGLTGGTATGKSTVAASLRRDGAAYFSVDEAAHDLYRPGGPACRPIARAFGRGVLSPAGGVQRSLLAARVARDPAALGRLEAIVHPWLRRSERAALARLRRRHAVTVVEAGPLLFVLGLHRACDAVALLHCPRRVRIARLRAARGWSAGEAAARLRLFAPAERRLARASRGYPGLARLDGALPPARLHAAARGLVARLRFRDRG